MTWCSEAEEAAVRDDQEAHFLLPVVDEHVGHLPARVAVLVLHLATPQVDAEARDHPAGVAQLLRTELLGRAVAVPLSWSGVGLATVLPGRPGCESQMVCR